MTTTALDIPDRDQPTEPTHPDWCQRGERCRINPNGSVTHSHLFGTVEDIDVYVEQTDRINDTGKKQSTTQVFADITRTGRLLAKDETRLNRLLGKAALFAGQRSPGCS